MRSARMNFLRLDNLFFANYATVDEYPRFSLNGEEELKKFYFAPLYLKFNSSLSVLRSADYYSANRLDIFPDLYMPLKLLSSINITPSAGLRYTGYDDIKNDGRFEILNINNAAVILDGAHNPDGIKNLISSLKNIYKKSNYIFVFGVMKDKDYKTMLRRLSNSANANCTVDIIFSNVDNERSMDSKLLKQYSDNLKYFNNSYAVKNIKEAIDKAFHIYANNNKNKIIVICGSLYLLGDFKKIN